MGKFPSVFFIIDFWSIARYEYDDRNQCRSRCQPVTFHSSTNKSQFIDQSARSILLYQTSRGDGALAPILPMNIMPGADRKSVFFFFLHNFDIVARRHRYCHWFSIFDVVFLCIKFSVCLAYFFRPYTRRAHIISTRIKFTTSAFRDIAPWIELRIFYAGCLVNLNVDVGVSLVLCHEL